MFVLLAALVLVPSVVCIDNQWLALKFGADLNDHIEPFHYDMTPFRDSFSLCMWIKQVHTSSPYPIVFHYQASNNEILIGSNGFYNQIGLYTTGLNRLQSKFTSPNGTWFHYCMTYSRHSRYSGIKVYLDGDLIARSEGPGRSIKMGGTLFFNGLSYGRKINPYYGYGKYIFGGELYQFNMFSEVLSDASVKKIAQGGLCFDLEEFSAIRALRWEDILESPRNGNVTTGEVCDSKEELKARLTEIRELMAKVVRRLDETEAILETTEDELDSTKENLGAVVKELNSTKEDLGVVRTRLNKTETQLEEEIARHHMTEAQLENRHNRTEELLESCSATLRDSQHQLKNSRAFKNITRWDILYTRPYYNHQFTDELYEKLITSWEMLRNFIGVNMTEEIIEHFQQYHQDPECDSMEQFSSSMFEHFLEVRMTGGIMAHLRDHMFPPNSECNDDVKDN